MRTMFENLKRIEVAVIGNLVPTVDVAEEDEVGPRPSTSRLVAAR